MHYTNVQMHNTNRELDGSGFYTETESNSFNFETNNKMQVSAGRDIFHRVSKSDLEWLCFYFPSPCDWSKKLTLPSQPIRCKTKTNHDLVARVFPRFRHVACFYFEFSLVNDDVDLCSDW